MARVLLAVGWHTWDGMVEVKVNGWFGVRFRASYSQSFSALHRDVPRTPSQAPVSPVSHLQAPGHKFKHTKRAIEEAFGLPLHELFSEIDQQPVASGSIGQIHRAVLTEKGAAMAGEGGYLMQRVVPCTCLPYSPVCSRTVQVAYRHSRRCGRCRARVVGGVGVRQRSAAPASTKHERAHTISLLLLLTPLCLAVSAPLSLSGRRARGQHGGGQGAAPRRGRRHPAGLCHHDGGGAPGVHAALPGAPAAGADAVAVRGAAEGAGGRGSGSVGAGRGWAQREGWELVRWAGGCCYLKGSRSLTLQ